METKIKWNEGEGYITAAYEGSGSGSASISSDVNEGIDRVQSVNVETTDKSVSAELIVSQVGLREVFEPSDGLFVIANGGTFNVLKIGGEQPDTPVETYTRLTYIETTGKQYINTGYVVLEDDVIEMSYISTSATSEDKALFGVADRGIGSIWASIYSNTAYVRFGSTASVSVSNARIRYNIVLKKGNVVIEDLTGTPTFSAMPTLPLYVFACNNNDESAYMYGYCRTMGFKISKESGDVVMELKPCKRDSDGKVGMIDLVSGRFFASDGNEEFIGGSEMSVPDGYNLIDYTTFNKDKLYEAAIIDNTCRLEVMFERSDSTSTPYLYGVLTSPHTASVSAYLSSGGSWRFGSGYKGISMNNTRINNVEVYYGYIVYNFTSTTMTKSTFTTPDTLVLGGYRDTSGKLYKSYNGKVYYFRVTKDGEPLLNWYPCKRLSDGVEGFWDCVTQSFVEPI